MGYICYDVRCLNCGEAFYETTETYNPNKMTTGDMLRFKKKYGPEGYNWSLPFSDHDMSEGIVCVECGGPLAPSGKVQVEPFKEAGGVRREARGEEEHKADIPGLDFYETAKIIDQAMKQEITQALMEESPPEPEGTDDPVTKYLLQRACPECGRFFGVDEWEDHLVAHTPEVRAQILKKVEPVVETPPIMLAKPLGEAQIGGLLSDSQKATKKSKGIGRFLRGGARLQAELIPEIDEPDGIFCSLCEARFDKDKQGDFDAHFKTHDLGNVQQSVQQ